MSVRKSIFLHIGSPKTGTSSIQSFLFFNWEPLLSHMIQVPTSLSPLHQLVLADAYRPGRFDEVVAAAMKIGGIPVSDINPEVWDLKRDGMAKDMWSSLSESPAHKLIISNEGFFERLDLGEIRRLKRRLSSVGEVEAIVLYLREPTSYCLSFWNTYIRSGAHFENLRFWTPEAVPPSIDPAQWPEKIRRWKDVFGDQLLVRLYDEPRVKEDLIADFARSFNMSFIGDLPRPARSNESVSMSVLQTVNEFNRMVPRTKLSAGDLIRRQQLINLFVESNGSGRMSVSCDLLDAYVKFFTPVGKELQELLQMDVLGTWASVNEANREALTMGESENFANVNDSLKLLTRIWERGFPPPSG